jgi:hypothetical protein
VGVVGRLLAEGMPLHVLERARLWHTEDSTVYLRLEPGAGSAPDAEALLHPTGERPASGAWSACFASYEEMLAYVVPQDRAFSVQPWQARVTRQEIELGIPLDVCEPLEGALHSQAARALVGESAPFCFRVPSVAFRFEREEHDPLL